jgi:hypothetical protein
MKDEWCSSYTANPKGLDQLTECGHHVGKDRGTVDGKGKPNLLAGVHWHSSLQPRD